MISLPVFPCLFRFDSRHEVGVRRHSRVQCQQTLYVQIVTKKSHDSDLNGFADLIHGRLNMLWSEMHTSMSGGSLDMLLKDIL